MGDPAEKIDPSDAEAIGTRVLRQLDQQGIPVDSLNEELDAEATAQALAWLRGGADDEEPPAGASPDRVRQWVQRRWETGPSVSAQVRSDLLRSLDETDLPEFFRESMRRDVERL